jgi:hypothetical protein
MNRLPFGKRQLIQVKLAIFFNDRFCMKCLHDTEMLAHIPWFDKR